MSFRVFVVCEDHTLDQYVAVPVVKACLDSLSKPRAIVKPVTSPRLTGISVVEREFENVSTRYAAIGDVVVFALDLDGLDGQDGNGDRIAAFESRLEALEQDVKDKVIVLFARQETEVWALWGSRSRIAAGWAEVRRERDSKELYFAPLCTADDRREPGQGRARLTALSLAAGWSSLAQGCPELGEFTMTMKAKI